MAFTDYTTANAGSGGGMPSLAPGTEGYATIDKLKKQYLDYLATKREEIDEQKASRRYRHGAHYTSEQVEALRKRKQPIVTYNRIGRKIDGVVGLVERLRQDPKAYPRTPQEEKGAELATAVIRYVMDEQEWNAKSYIVASDIATEGIGGIEVILSRGNKGDVEVEFDVVDPEGFFYDARSSRLDFSDARYMGVGKWMDVEAAKELFPDKAADLEAALEGSELTSNSDKEQKWFSSDQSRVRVIDHWYMHRGQWCWCVYTGSMKLMEGRSFLIDDKDKTYCKYVMASANVDHDGDRYGFARNLKSAQDEINARRSKGIHELHTRRIIAEKGAFDDIEVTRREAARPDGIIERNPGMEAAFDDAAKAANLQGQLEFLNEAKNEIENFGPNPALIGHGIENRSGRAIQLMQQSGIAELGPYILSFKNWKLRVYRALFNAIRQHWTGERWVRVTDDNDVAQFIRVNGVTVGANGMPALVNAIGMLDVDIILDEGPDEITLANEAHETIGAVLQSVGPMLSQPEARAAVKLLIDTSSLPVAAKQEFRRAAEQASQPSPGDQLQLAAGEAKVADTQAAAKLKEAQAIKTLMEVNAPHGAPMDAGPTPIEQYKTAADAEAALANARLRDAQTLKTSVEAQLMPQKFAQEAQGR